MSLSTAFNQLKSVSNDPVSVKNAIKQAKMTLLQKKLLIFDGTQSNQDTQQARSILEACALLSLKTNDVASFERFTAQLAPFYSAQLPPSDLRPRLTGLHLLLLLSRNEIGSFHTLIESLSAEEDASLLRDPSVSYPIEMEKWLMEGSFTKIWEASRNPPSDEYKVFLADLMSTVRNEIAACGEKAYATLPIRDAATLLFFTELNDLLAFASARPGWTVNPSTQGISFKAQDANLPATSTLLDKQKIISATLEYAKELETIV